MTGDRAEARYGSETHLATAGDSVTLCGKPTFGMSLRVTDGLTLCSECALITAELAALADREAHVPDPWPGQPDGSEVF